MRRHLPLTVALSAGLLFAGCGSDGGIGGPAPSAIVLSGDAIANDLRTLSGDDFAGRAPGTEGGRAAAEYIADQFAEIGLQPPGESYFQAVPMVGSTPLPSSAVLSLSTGGVTFQGSYLDDFMIWSGDAEAGLSEADGELVFVGYGIDAPENNWSDFDGIDLSGKILLILVNDPPAPPEEPELFGGRAMTYYGRWTYKFEEAARQGAAGAFIIHTTEEAGYGWNVVSGSWSGEQFSLPPDPSAAPPTAIQGWVTYELAERFLSGAGQDLEALVANAGSRDFQPVPTGIQVQAVIRSAVRRVETQNVVGILPGTDRPEEAVVLTSHYDHLGVGQAVEGDSIYNGAYDNASGTALLLEVARAVAKLEDRLPRSLLFLATAAEEQGLLGAAWYVQDPIIPLASTVAEINVDGANLWGETDDLIAMGAERSELGPIVERRASELGMSLMPDAEPEKGFFFRSDHFPFAKAGVPSLYIEHGRQYRGQPPGFGQQIQDDYTANRYHQPSDEWDDAFTFEGAVQQGMVVVLTALDLARSDAWPNWAIGSEFRAARDAMR